MDNREEIGVTGIGGIFFKCKDIEATKNWYKNNLGLVTNEYGSLFEFRTVGSNSKIGYLQWSPFSNETDYFLPSEKDFMINYRVNNLDELLIKLKNNGVEILDSIERYEYGNFLHILDSEKNKIELWEPIDSVFTNLYNGKTTMEIGIGGFLFKSKNPDKLIKWYSDNLNFKVNSYGSLFSLQNPINHSVTNYLQWSPMPEDTTYFSPTEQQYMINYRIENLQKLIETLTANKVEILDSIEYTEYGNFVHIMGPENIKIELWEHPTNVK